MRLLKLMIVIAICLNLSFVVYAHPGRTDSQGGHTNHSTGEYHYHHGYSAHQHYDKDGDGTLDCPYDFNDKTGSSSGSSKITKDSSQSSSKNESSSKTPVKSSTKENLSEKTTSSENKTNFSAIGELLLIFGSIVGLLVAWIGSFWVLGLVLDVFKRIFKR